MANSRSNQGTIASVAYLCWLYLAAAVAPVEPSPAFHFVPHFPLLHWAGWLAAPLAVVHVLDLVTTGRLAHQSTWPARATLVFATAGFLGVSLHCLAPALSTVWAAPLGEDAFWEFAGKPSAWSVGSACLIWLGLAGAGFGRATATRLPRA